MAGYDLDLAGGVRGSIPGPGGFRHGIRCRIIGVTNIRRWDGDLATFPSQMRSERGKGQVKDSLTSSAADSFWLRDQSTNSVSWRLMIGICYAFIESAGKPILRAR
jgi:hypothetical protein